MKGIVTFQGEQVNYSLCTYARDNQIAEKNINMACFTELRKGLVAKHARALWKKRHDATKYVMNMH